MWCCSFFLFDCSNNLDFGICDMLVTCLKKKKTKKKKQTHNMYVYSYAWEWKCTMLPWDIQCTHIQNIANLRYGNLKMQIFLDGMC